jgi:hypothetical protein
VVVGARGVLVAVWRVRDARGGVCVIDTRTKTKTNACARRGEGGRDDDSASELVRWGVAPDGLECVVDKDACTELELQTDEEGWMDGRCRCSPLRSSLFFLVRAHELRLPSVCLDSDSGGWVERIDALLPPPWGARCLRRSTLNARLAFVKPSLRPRRLVLCADADVCAVPSFAGRRG